MLYVPIFPDNEDLHLLNATYLTPEEEVQNQKHEKDYDEPRESETTAGTDTLCYAIIQLNFFLCLLFASSFAQAPDPGEAAEQEHLDFVAGSWDPSEQHRDVPCLRRRIPSDDRQGHGKDKGARRGRRELKGT